MDSFFRRFLSEFCSDLCKGDRNSFFEQIFSEALNYTNYSKPQRMVTQKGRQQYVFIIALRNA